MFVYLLEYVNLKLRFIQFLSSATSSMPLAMYNGTHALV